MSISSGLGKLLDSFRSVAVAADLAQLGTLAVGAAGATVVGGPIAVCGAVAIAAIAGFGIYRDWQTGKEIDKIETIKNWLEKLIRRENMRDKSLADVLSAVLTDPAAEAALPAGLTGQPLADLLAIIRAEGKEREALLEKQTALTRSLSELAIEKFDEIQATLDLHTRDFASIRSSLRLIEGATDRIQHLLWQGSGPPLRIPRLPLTESSRFIYSARRVTLAGRTTELAELDAFLDHGDRFRWSAWTGLAGAGKSRLALEVCLTRGEQGWDTGFYDWDATHATRWETWQPQSPTLIVFDYVAQHTADLHDALVHLARGAKVLQHPVRVLLLERPAPEAAFDEGRITFDIGSWWRDLIEPGSQTDAAQLHATNHEAVKGKARPRELGGVSDTAVKTMLREIAGLREQPEPSDATLEVQTKAIRSVDPLMRPLFVALAAEALESGSLEPNWIAEDLTAYVLDKERDRWKKDLTARGVVGETAQQPWLNLLLLSTLCGGLLLDDNAPSPFEDEDAKKWIPDDVAYNDGSMLAAIVPNASARFIPPIEPDMLGELFVLRAMRQWSSRDKAMKRAAWRLDGEGHQMFLGRAANSFARSQELDHLLEEGDGAEKRAIVLPWALRGDRLQALGDVPGETKATQTLIDLLRPLVAAEPKHPNWRTWFTISCSNAIARSKTDFVRADGLLRELRTLAQKHPDDSAVRENLASGLYNAFNNNEPNSAHADGLLRELRTLAGAHPDDSAVREELASGLFNAFNGSEPNSARADGLLRELRTLAGAHPDDSAVRERLAKGLFNALCDSEPNSARADWLLGDLRTLAEKYPDDSAVRGALAKGLYNAFNNSAPNSARADDLLGELRALAGAHPDDNAMRKILAMGLFNAFNNSAPNSVRADDLLGDLRALAETHPDDSAVREQLARGEGAAMRGALEASDLARAVTQAEALATLREALLAQAKIVPLARQVFAAALALASEKNDADAGKRLMAASRAIFGEEAG